MYTLSLLHLLILLIYVLLLYHRVTGSYHSFSFDCRELWST